MRARFTRYWVHLWSAGWQLRRAFPDALLDEIEARITAGEQRHGAELRFVIEARLAPAAVWARVTARARAVELFSELGVWDTERNNGVLVYVLLADHAVEIVADRGARALIDPTEWKQACTTMSAAYARGEFREGSLRAIELLDDALAAAFPPGQRNPDELPNRPLVR